MCPCPRSQRMIMLLILGFRLSGGVLQWELNEQGLLTNFARSPNCEMKVMNLQGTQELHCREEGELWVRGPNVCKGYWRNQATATAFSEDGWFKTGDIASISEDSMVRVVARASVSDSTTQAESLQITRRPPGSSTNRRSSHCSLSSRNSSAETSGHKRGRYLRYQRQ